MSKTCTKCGEIKPLDAFYTSTTSKDGKRNVCAECNRLYAREWGRKNSERKKAAMKAWRAANKGHVRTYKALNRERELDQKRERYWAEPEVARAKQRAFYHQNPEPYRTATADWEKRNPGKVAEHRQTEGYKIRHREWEHRRRATKRNTQVGSVGYESILAEHGMVCHICGGCIETMSDLHFDHVVPLARGGTHTAENIRPSHARCNLAKHTHLPEEVALSA